MKHQLTSFQNILQNEYKRQNDGLEMIASESLAPRWVRDAVGSIFMNKYAEGQVGQRYYGGCENVDTIETIAIQGALDTFSLDPNEWGVNVQPLSGSMANLAVYLALLNPGDTICSLSLASGGHLSHGHQRNGTPISHISKLFEVHQYNINMDGTLHYDELRDFVKVYSPKLLICGASCYPKDWDYQSFRHIADEVGALLLVDMSHISGLVAGGIHQSPFQYADVVTTTTHKTLCGPRAGIIFSRKQYNKAIDKSVFPGLQGGPQVHTISALACHFQFTQTSFFREWIHSIVMFAKCFEIALKKHQFSVVCETENHLVWIDLRPFGISGTKFEKVAELCGISLNRNSTPLDKSPSSPNGIRVGFNVLAQRKASLNCIVDIADLFFEIKNITIQIQNQCTDKKMITFMEELNHWKTEISQIQQKTQKISSSLLSLHEFDNIYK